MPKPEFAMPAAEMARLLARQAEAVCRYYLSAGKREGRYWLVGDVHNTPGRSLFVRLSGSYPGKGAAGRWMDAASGEHGDLLDIIRARCGLSEFRDVAEEARRFLGLAWGKPNHPGPTPTGRIGSAIGSTKDGGSPPTAGDEPGHTQDAARRLFARTQPLRGTLAETYLRHRGTAELPEIAALRFHPRCFYRADPAAPPEAWPAMVAAVTDLDGVITAVHRTWLDPDGFDLVRLGKAPVATPRRALGPLLGNAVRFGVASDIMAAGEGIETMLSLRCAWPALPMVASLSAAHLAALLLPTGLRRLYIARDADPAGDAATARLTQQAQSAGVETIILSPSLGDFNDDLRALGLTELRANLRGQIVPADVARFMMSR